MNARNLILTLALAFTLLPSVVACGGGMRTPEAVLEEQLRAFHSHVRWGRISEATSFVSDDHRQVFLGMHDELGDDFEVTEYEINGVTVDRGEDVAVVNVWMQWFRLPSTMVEEATYREVWTYNSDARVWQLTERERQD